MDLKKYILLAALVFSLCLPTQAFSVVAFPGAEGFGKDTVGGRGGTVYIVDTLADSGSGSLREAVEASGKRIVVFTVSGRIDLASDLVVSNPYITIAGQTSPGGILISTRPVRINTHEVIVQHIRFRMGTDGVVYQRDGSNDIIYYDQPQYNWPPNGAGGTCLGNITTEALGYPCVIAGGADPETIDSLQIVGNSEPTWYDNEAHDVIIDHCSVSWGMDEVLEVSLGATNVTIQWSIMSEALNKAGHPEGKHSKGPMIWGVKSKTAMDISFHHNYLAHNKDRNPYISGARTYAPYERTFLDAVNNVIYNFWGANAMISHSPAKVNWVHNFLKSGPDTVNALYEASHYETAGFPAEPSLYIEGNIGANRTSQSDPEWSVGVEWTAVPLDASWQATTRWTAPAITQATMSSSVADCILSAVGATAPLRDSVDNRVIQEFTDGNGSVKNSPPAWPDLATGAPAAPTDIDKDGMADTWETTNGLNVGFNDSAYDKDNDGYTNLEEYLHYLSIKSYTYNSTCMPDITAPSRPTNIVSN